MVEIKEEEYKEFFQWILEREVEIKKEIDLTLAHDYEEPFIYYTKEIEDFFKTKPMQRLGKIMQLATSILTNQNAYHTRLEHCKGAYKNALDFWLLRCKDENYRKKIEKENGKVKILADIMEMARHDDCHTMLSHVLEKKLCCGKAKHEDIGKRILLERKEYEVALENIQKGLYEQMCDNTVKGQSEFQFLKEGNIDFDRMDYLIRDLLYTGGPQSREVVENLNEKCNIKEFTINSEKIKGPVYTSDALSDIKKALTIRMNQYINDYCSPNRNILDTLLRSLCDKIMQDNSNLGLFIKESINNYEKNIEEINVNKFLQTDDIRFYIDVLQIAKEHEEPDMREFASLCTPNVTALIQMTIEMLNPKNRDLPYDENEKIWIEQIQNLKDEKSELQNRLNERKEKQYIYVSPKNKEEYEKIKEEISQIFNKDSQDIEGLITWNRRVRMYKKSEPIYIEDEFENIYTLDQYPNLDMDLSDREFFGISVVPVQMRMAGYSKEQIKQMCEIIEKYRKEDMKTKEQKEEIQNENNRMSMFQVGKEPYIIGLE